MNIYDLGFGNNLEKQPLFSTIPGASQNSFSNGVSPGTLSSGEMTSDIRIRGSFIVNDGVNDRILIGFLEGKF